MADPILPPDFGEFLRLLNAHQVDYLIVGGYAQCGTPAWVRPFMAR